MLKSVIRRLMIQHWNRRNANAVSPDSLCSPLLARRLSHVTIKPGSLVDTASDIGSHCYIGYYSFISAAVIGRYCSIANNVSIGPGEHPLDSGSTHAMFADESAGGLTAAPIVIGNDVWIGVGAIILRGVSIGNGAVIGAGAVVTRDVAPYTIVAGVPARLIRDRMPPEMTARHIASGWWSHPPEAARKILAGLAETPNGN